MRKKEITVGDIKTTVDLVVNVPDSWSDAIIVRAVEERFAGSVDVTIGKTTDEFPDLEWLENGEPAISLTDIMS